MKKVEYCGYQIEIEDWAKWIATDEDGTVMQYALEPVIDCDTGEFYPQDSIKDIRFQVVLRNDEGLAIYVEDWNESARKVSELIHVEEQGND